MIGRARYVGTADDIPEDITIPCPLCDATGESRDVFELLLKRMYGHDVIEEGTRDEMRVKAAAMNHKPVDGTVYMVEPGECKHCVGTGSIEADDVEQYLRVTRHAVAVREVDIGQYGEQSAVLYFTAEEVDAAGITDPAAALESHAEEYRQWEDGDCWGYVCEGPASEDSCWGFIGGDYAVAEGNAAFRWALHRAAVEHAEATYWAARDVETVS